MAVFTGHAEALLGMGRPFTITKLDHYLGIPRPTVGRYLAAVTEHGVVERYGSCRTVMIVRRRQRRTVGLAGPDAIRAARSCRSRCAVFARRAFDLTSDIERSEQEIVRAKSPNIFDGDAAAGEPRLTARILSRYELGFYCSGESTHCIL
jgi:DNA-binding transcriptional ArsR family regulator